MKKLVSSSEAAKILGLSLQGIHYRIKKGQLESTKKDGKIFVYIDSKVKSSYSTSSSIANHDESDLIKVKNEQIELLKKSIKFIKKQKDNEIVRLERQQDKIMNVFQSEVDLLKSAFNEMRTIYKIADKPNISNSSKNTPSAEEPVKEAVSDVRFDFMDIKDFFIFMREHNKTDSQIKAIILEKVKNGDKRFIYKKDTKEVMIYKSDFLDLM